MGFFSSNEALRYLKTLSFIIFRWRSFMILVFGYNSEIQCLTSGVCGRGRKAD